MNRFERKISLRVLGIHAAVIAFLFLQSLLNGCFSGPKPSPKPDRVTFVEFGSPALPPDFVEVDNIPETESETVEKESAQSELVRPELPPTEPVEKEPEQSTPKYTRAEDIPIGPRVNEIPVQPKVEVKGAFDHIVKLPETAGNPNEISAYDEYIQSVFYKAWEQPAVGAARPTKLTISITSTGQIKNWSIIQPSGDPEYDATVERAVRRISKLPKQPPAGYPLNDILINFSINSY